MHVWFPAIISCSSRGYDYSDEPCSGPGTLSGLEKLESNKTSATHHPQTSGPRCAWREATEVGPLSCEVVGSDKISESTEISLLPTVGSGAVTQPCWEALCLYLTTDVCCIEYVGREWGGGRSLVEMGYSRKSNLWWLPTLPHKSLLFCSVLSFQIAMTTFWSTTQFTHLLCLLSTVHLNLH